MLDMASLLDDHLTTATTDVDDRHGIVCSTRKAGRRKLPRSPESLQVQGQLSRKSAPGTFNFLETYLDAMAYYVARLRTEALESTRAVRVLRSGARGYLPWTGHVTY